MRVINNPTVSFITPFGMVYITVIVAMFNHDNNGSIYPGGLSTPNHYSNFLDFRFQDLNKIEI